MNSTESEMIANATKACNEWGFSFVDVYEYNGTDDGWDKFIYSPSPINVENYRFVGVVRAGGTFERRFKW